MTAETSFVQFNLAGSYRHALVVKNRGPNPGRSPPPGELLDLCVFADDVADFGGAATQLYQFVMQDYDNSGDVGQWIP